MSYPVSEDTFVVNMISVRAFEMTKEDERFMFCGRPVRSGDASVAWKLVIHLPCG